MCAAREDTSDDALFARPLSEFRAAVLQLVLHIARPKARLYVPTGANIDEFCDLSTNACARDHFPKKLLFQMDLSGLEFEVERQGELQNRSVRITRLLNALLK